MSNQGHESFDVVVVGDGGSGLAAAIEAARFGRSVVLLEKNAALGGMMIRSVVSVTSTYTQLQRAKGLHDIPQADFEDMALFADNRGFAKKDNLELRRLVVEHSPDMVAWLMDMGVVFFGPMPEPPHRQPRMHNVLPHSRSFIFHLRKRALRLGVDLRVDAQVTRLTRDGARVSGVEIDGDGGARRIIEATRGVILATGDYSAAKELKSQFMSAELTEVEGINPASTGFGQRLVQEASGTVVNGDIRAVCCSKGTDIIWAGRSHPVGWRGGRRRWATPTGRMPRLPRAVSTARVIVTVIRDQLRYLRTHGYSEQSSGDWPLNRMVGAVTA
jgi:succinate dehydrogenase/fumarate reductase flavoprotein subunit